ncbi:hypothetical protein ES703_99959 [subsurface metagenome]
MSDRVKDFIRKGVFEEFHLEEIGYLSAADNLSAWLTTSQLWEELCYVLSQDGWTGEQIAKELGWSESNVAQHKQIKEDLHPQAWVLARYSFTRNGAVVKEGTDEPVNHDFTIVNWRESYFRARRKDAFFATVQ